jgi:GAF domain-containing protein
LSRKGTKSRTPITSLRSTRTKARTRLSRVREPRADLEKKLAESLEQRTALAEVLQIISSSPGDLEPVFNTILKNATRICEASFGNLLLRDGDVFRRVALYNAPRGWDELTQRNPTIHPGPKDPLVRLVATKQLQHITDIRAEQAYIEREPAFVGLAELAGARTLINVPMLKENRLIGTIAIYRQEVRPFTDTQIELLTNFASQAVIAIENTRLLNELRESLQQQTATSEVLQVISSSPGELEPVFQAMLENATRVCGSNFGTLYLREGDAFRAVSMHGATPTYMQRAWVSCSTRDRKLVSGAHFGPKMWCTFPTPRPIRLIGKAIRCASKRWMWAACGHCWTCRCSRRMRLSVRSPFIGKS